MTNEQVPNNATNILILLTKVEDPLQFCKIRIKSTKTKVHNKLTLSMTYC